MLKIDTTTSGPSLASMPPKFKAAASRALGGLAFDVRDALREGMRDSFDKPNAFTLMAFRADPPQDMGDHLEAVVWAMPRQAKYLFWEVEGGDRASKAFEHKLGLFGGRVAVPVGRFGQQYDRAPKGFVSRMIRDIEAGAGASGKRWFVGHPKGRDGQDGVWARTGKGKLLKVMSFESGANYKPKLDVPGIADRAVQKHWPGQIARWLGQ